MTMECADGSPTGTNGFAYLVIAHHKGDQLLRLLRTMRQSSPTSHILLHHDAKTPPPPKADLDALHIRLVQPRISVRWGDFSQVDAILTGLKFALTQCDFTWISVISGQDYPVRPLATVESELQSCGFDAFVKATPAGPYLGRYQARFWTLPRFPYIYRIPSRWRAALGRARHWLNCSQSLVRIEPGARGARTHIGLYWPSHPFGKDLVCHKGSDRFTLSRRAVEYLLRFGQKHPDILEHYRRTFLPSESYFQTVLCNAKTLRVCNDDRRYIRWDHGATAHPLTSTVEHLADLAESGKDFARKFDATVDAAVLDRLDEIVLKPRLHPPSTRAPRVLPA